MEKLKPKLFSVMKTYTKEQFVKDVVAGVIVAIIALPLSIALALASGVTPEKGESHLPGRREELRGGCVFPRLRQL